MVPDPPQPVPPVSRLHRRSLIMPAEDGILTEAGGITAGSWYANPAGYVGVQLVVARALIIASGRTCSGVWNMGSIMPTLLATP